MRSNRRRDTKPERALRSELHRSGLRFRVDFPIEAGRRVRPDIAFTRRRLAVFIDGCFWHGCDVHKKLPRTNAGYWAEKIRRNRERDRATDAALTEAGWIVLRVWEHDDPAEVSNRIRQLLAVEQGEKRIGLSTRVS